MNIVFENNMGTCVVCIAVAIGLAADLPKRSVFVYSGVDWLKLISESA